MSRIFISYRRDDSAAEAGRIYDFLERAFGEDSIFKDVDDIDAGDDFRERLNEAVGQCQVLLAVIGKDWLDIKDGAGQRRLDNPADWVRLEIETALKRKIRVIPVLLDGVAMPRVEVLPKALEALAFRNAAFVRHDPDFRKDIRYVIEVIQRHFVRLEQRASKSIEPVPKSVAVSMPEPIAKSLPEQAAQPTGKKAMLTFEVVKVNAQGTITQREKRSAEYHQENLGGGVTLELMRVPGGEFVMGSPTDEVGDDHERPLHRVLVPEFWMGRYPVTQAQWRAVAALPKVDVALNPEPSRFKGDKRPVEEVSWYEAKEFCRRLAKRTGVPYRLPSEAEWEYACRAGTTTRFHFGQIISAEIANYNTTADIRFSIGTKDDYRGETTDVGAFPSNDFGLFDMHGNVREWCGDLWYSNYEGAPTNGSVWLSNTYGNRVTRGGSWNYNPWYCRSAYRSHGSSSYCSHELGFRVSCSIPRTLA